MDCMEIDMEQNEQKEDKGFENFADQGKNKNIVELKEKKADRYAKISGILLLSAFILWGSIPVMESIIISTTGQTGEINVIGNAMLIGAILLYVLAVVCAVRGYFIKPTRQVKEKLILVVVIPVSILIVGISLFLFFDLLFGWFK